VIGRVGHEPEFRGHNTQLLTEFRGLLEIHFVVSDTSGFRASVRAQGFRAQSSAIPFVGGYPNELQFAAVA
jgi:hypothetical protein